MDEWRCLVRVSEVGWDGRPGDGKMSAHSVWHDMKGDALSNVRSLTGGEAYQPWSAGRSDRRMRTIRSQAAMCIRSRAYWTRPLGSVSLDRCCKRGNRAFSQSRF